MLEELRPKSTKHTRTCGIRQPRHILVTWTSLISLHMVVTWKLSPFSAPHNVSGNLSLCLKLLIGKHRASHLVAYADTSKLGTPHSDLSHDTGKVTNHAYRPNAVVTLSGTPTDTMPLSVITLAGGAPTCKPDHGKYGYIQIEELYHIMM